MEVQAPPRGEEGGAEIRKGASGTELTQGAGHSEEGPLFT